MNICICVPMAIYIYIVHYLCMQNENYKVQKNIALEL